MVGFMERLIEQLQSRRLGVLYILKMVSVRSWDWRPEPKMKTTAELAAHLAASPMLLWEALRGTIPDEETYEQRGKELMPDSPPDLVVLYEEGLSKLV